MFKHSSAPLPVTPQIRLMNDFQKEVTAFWIRHPEKWGFLGSNRIYEKTKKNKNEKNKTKEEFENDVL